MEPERKIKAIFDNGGETFDRYTLVDDDGDVFGYSENAAGFDQFCGNCIEWGTSIDEYINIDSTRLGKRLNKKEWPKAIKQAYSNRIIHSNN